MLDPIGQMAPNMHDSGGQKIAIVTGRVPYPCGMAATQRIHLIARALTEGGSKVTVLVDGLDTKSNVRNRFLKGEQDGVSYEYLLGKTIASSVKWKRIFDRLLLAWISRRKVLADFERGLIDVLYFYTPVSNINFERFTQNAVFKSHRVPIVLDFREAPWSMDLKRSFVENLTSPLWGGDGALCISQYLSEWVCHEAQRTSKRVRTLQIPILVDASEVVAATSSPSNKSVLFSGAAGYDQTIEFLLGAMQSVWREHPDCELVLTGGTTAQSIREKSKASCEKIRFTGYLPRQDLLKEYERAAVLAIPLHADVRSMARFPTKLGEYLASGRPVVTNSVGEIPHFLADGVNARVVAPGDQCAFGLAILELLTNQQKAGRIGTSGRSVAETQFHYANYSKPLCAFFQSLKRHKPGF